MVRLRGEVTSTRLGGRYDYTSTTCPNCHGTDIVKHGKSPEGKQRYKCRETACDGRTFILDYAYQVNRAVKQQIVDMALNGSGVRDTARVYM